MIIERARFNMVEQQVRPWDVLDKAVLDLLHRAPRDEYAPVAYRSLAYADTEIRLAADAFMWSPRLEGRALQALALNRRDRVLEIGTGSGFFTSLLAALSGHVTSVEINPDLVNRAIQNLKAHNVVNVRVECADGRYGFERYAPYHAIVQTGAVETVGDGFLDQLEIGGRAFVIVGNPPAMEAQLIERIDEQEWAHTSLFETDIALLKVVEPTSLFVF